jgi:Uma2 family endonuclease
MEVAANPRQQDPFDSLQCIPMTEEAFEQLINIEGPYRYEFIDGFVYDMTGSSPEHSDIVGTIERLFWKQLGKNGPCRAHQGLYVAIPGKPSVVPDVVVTCDLADWDKNKRLDPFRIQSPLIVVEVLSPSTERYDYTEKFARYRLCPTLEVYILASQDEPYIEVYRKANGWQRECYGSDQIVKLEQLDLELPLALIYEGVF